MGGPGKDRSDVRDLPPLVKTVNGTLYRQASYKAVLWIGLAMLILFIAGSAMAALGVMHLLEVFKNTDAESGSTLLFVGLSALVISVKTIGWLFIENSGVLWLKVRTQGIPAPRKYNNGEMA